MKKITLLIFSLMLVLSLNFITGCKKAESPEPTAPAATEETAPATEEPTTAPKKAAPGY